MNVLLGVILLIVCTAIGYILSLKFTKRKKFFFDFLMFNKRFESEVSFSQKSLFDLIDEDSKHSDFNDLLFEYLNNGAIIKYDYLKDDEKDFVDVYLNAIGKSDKGTQVKFLDGAQKRIETYSSFAIEEDKKYKMLYIKLGFLFGLIAFVIIL